MKSNKKRGKVIVKKINQPRVINKKSNKIAWIIGAIIFVVLAVGAIYFGNKNTENKFSDILSKKPTPTINIATKKPDSEAHPPGNKDIDIMEPPPTAKPTKEIEPTIVPDKDLSTDDYLLSISSSQKLTQEDLVDFSDLDLKKIRNEIYARHGRSFVSQDMACYFAKQSWYEVNPKYSEKLLSSLEVSNAVFVLNYEKERKSPLINKDSGCI